MLHSPCRRCRAGGRHASRICSAAGLHGPPVLGGERTVRAYHGLAQVLSSDVRSRPFPATLCLAMLSLQRELSLAPYCQTMLVFHLNNLFLPKEILLLQKNATVKADFSTPDGPHVCHTDHKATTGFLNSNPFSSKHKPEQCWHAVPVSLAHMPTTSHCPGSSTLHPASLLSQAFPLNLQDPEISGHNPPLPQSFSGAIVWPFRRAHSSQSRRQGLLRAQCEHPHRTGDTRPGWLRHSFSAPTPMGLCLPVSGCCCPMSHTVTRFPTPLVRMPSAVGWNCSMSTGPPPGPSVSPALLGSSCPSSGRRQTFTCGTRKHGQTLEAHPI